MKSPLKGKYLVQNPLANFFLRCLDRILSLFPASPESTGRPKKILVANLAHMGDALMMTSLLAALKSADPEVKLGVVVGSWSRPIVEGHPLIDVVHTVDHWKLNRSPLPLWKKIVQYYATKRRAVREIRAQSYDAAIDSYPFFPNAIPLLWQAKVPMRIGFTSGGFGPVLTHPVDWTASGRHMIYSYGPLLQKAGSLPEAFYTPPRPSLPPVREKHALPSKGHIVVHMGTGNPIKEWPLEKWREFAQKMEGIPLVFTGKGEKERENAAKVSASLSGCTNLVDQLSWDAYLALIKEGRCLVGVDSLAGHVAAALETPSVLIYSGMTDPAQWAPFGNFSTVLSHPVPCAPCYRSQGCRSMDCVRGVTVENVVAQVKKILTQTEVP